MADAALYFEEAVAERALEPVAENISFTFGWVIRVPNIDTDPRMIQTSFGTNYKAGSCEWNVQLRLRSSPFSLLGLDRHGRHRSMSQAHILVETARNTKILGGLCNIAYTVYHDDEMRYELYSSTKVAAIPSAGMITDGLRFRTPAGGFIEKLTNAFKKHEGKRIAIYIEMVLPTKFFLRHFEESSVFSKKLPKYPADIEDDFRFDFIENGDYTIKFSDGGELKANRQALYLSSLYFRKLLPSSRSKEFNCHHSIDAVKPIIWYFHCLSFEMPETYELDYVQKIMDAIEFLNPVSKIDLMNGVHRALCQKLANESSPEFDMVLQMASIANKHGFQELKYMACSLLANEFYGKLKATYPTGEPNFEDPRFVDLFMPQHFIGLTPYAYIEKIHRSGFRTNVIL